MIRWSLRCGAVAVVLLALAAPPPARAIPVYSRKYATSCGTCHSIYPKLTPFGEAFRRNGLRFPGAFDSDYIKQELIPLGQDAAKKDFPNATWPSYMTSVPLLGFAVSSRVTLHPDTKSAAAVVDHNQLVSFERLATSGSIYATANIDDSITVMAMVAVSDTGASLDETLITWSDIVGPRHLVNLSVGYAFPTISPFARTSTYVGGRQTLALPMTTLFGWAGAPFRVGAKYNLAEVNGTVAGRVEYGFGLANGSHFDAVQGPENVYAHVGAKFGGMRLDGEGGYTPADPVHYWRENSLSAWAYAYRSNTRFNTTPKAATPTVAIDKGASLGGGLRGQLGSAELTLGGLWEDHGHVSGVIDSLGRPGPATQIAASAELSYMIYPWLVPAVRVEHVIIKPRDLASASDTRILPAVGMHLRNNMKLAVSATFESASGELTGGGAWSKDSGDGLFLKPANNTTSMGFQLSLVTVSGSVCF